MKIVTFIFKTFLFCCAGRQVIAQCGLCQYEAQLVTNGAFTSGNNGFTTDYNLGTGFFCPLCPESTYGVGFNAFFFHTDFVGTDHTNPPTGNFMIVNGSGTAGTEVWCQTVNVQPNTDYDFTYWMQDVTDNPDIHPLAQLVVMIDGVQLGNMIEAAGTWQQWTATWNSGNETQVEICIVNMQNQTGGNDFGLDDISMTGCHTYLIANTAYAGQDQTICSNETIQLGEPAVANFTYEWDNATGLSNTTTSNPTLTISNNTGNAFFEQYILTTDSAGVGCVMQDTVLITILPVPVFELGADILICEGETTTLDAGPGWDNVLWNTGINAQTIETGTENTYSATVEFNGCTTTDNVFVEVVDLPAIDLGADQIICSNESALLASSVSSLWSTGETGMFINVNTTGNYWCTYTAQGCTASDTIFVEVFDFPVIMLDEDAWYCQGGSTTLDAGQPVYWSTNTTSAFIEVNQQGNYTWLASNGPCSSTGNVYVTEIPLPFVELGSDLFGCDDEVHQLDAAPADVDPYSNYFWSTADTTSTIEAGEAGIYWVNVYNECGLVSDTIQVFLEPCGFDLFIPNTFTPNSDGTNEGWFVQGYNIKSVKIHVYNRLGNLIFYSETLGESWQPGELLPGDDVYNYLVQAVNSSGEEFQRIGYIRLLR